MKPYRGTLLASAILLSALPLFGCGNALEGGSNPSGSRIYVQSVSAETYEPDLYLSICSPEVINADGTVTPAEYEDGLTNTYATVTMFNDSTPNSVTGTNSYVTMSRYRVDFTGVSMNVDLPSIDGSGLTVGLPVDGTTGAMTVLVMDHATLEYIRSHYPTVGSAYGDSLTLRANITIWGEDEFQVTVSTEAEITLVVDDYNRC